MFDFFSSDTFTIGLEIFFLIFIVYDLKRYFETKKREYIVNVILAAAFFIYAAIPFYNQYYTWSTHSKLELNSPCNVKSDPEDKKLCVCLNKHLTKEYSYTSYQTLDKEENSYIELIDTLTKECKE
jgi:hypothetical protein